MLLAGGGPDDRDDPQAGTVRLLRPDDVAVRHLPLARADEDPDRGRRRLLPEAVPHARRRDGARLAELHAGRNEGFDASKDRFPLSAIRRRIVDCGGPFGEGDIIPLPCNPQSIAIGYALRKGAKIAPVTSFFPRELLVEALPNAIAFEKHPDLHRQVLEFFSLATAECNNEKKLAELLCCLPKVPLPAGLGYEDTFRV